MPPNKPPEDPPDNPDAIAKRKIEQGTHYSNKVTNSTLIPDKEKKRTSRIHARAEKNTLDTRDVDRLEKKVIPGLQEVFDMFTPKEISNEQLLAYQNMESKVTPLFQAKKFDDAIVIIKKFVENNPHAPHKSLLEINLMDAIFQKVEDVLSTPAYWGDDALPGFLERHYGFIERRIERMLVQPKGEEMASFYLQSLYYQGRIKKDHRLFQKLLEINPKFEQVENQHFEEQQGQLKEQLNIISQQLQLNVSEDQKRDLLNQRKSLSGEMISRYLKHSFPEEFNQLAFRMFEAHSTLQEWQDFRGNIAEEKREKAMEELTALQSEWQSLVQKLQKQGVDLPTYTNKRGNENLTFSPITGREIDLETWEAMPTEEEIRKMETQMTAIDLASVVGAVYTAGYGSMVAREGLKRVVTNAFMRDALAISVAGGTSFSVSHKAYRNMLSPAIGVEGNWSLENMTKDIPRDIVLFTVLRGVTMKFDPTRGVAVSRLANPVAQTGLEATTLVGFQQGERVYEGQSPGEAVQHLPDDILVVWSREEMVYNIDTLLFYPKPYGTDFTPTRHDNATNSKRNTRIFRELGKASKEV